jgi:predicted DNA-binding transcriptional regulator AlpA
MVRKKGGRQAVSVDPNNPAERYISAAELRQRIPVSDMTIWRWLRDSKMGFPQPVKFGQQNFWWLPTVQEWERQCAEQTELSAPKRAS